MRTFKGNTNQRSIYIPAGLWRWTLAAAKRQHMTGSAMIASLLEKEKASRRNAFRHDLDRAEDHG